MPCRKRRERHDEQLLLAERRPVALGVLEQRVGLGDPERAAPALQPVVEDDAGDLPALAGAGAVAEEPAAAEADGVWVTFGSGGDRSRRFSSTRPGAGEMRGMRLARA